MAKRFLYLIRHGQYTITPDLPYGKLTALGEQQATHTGAHLLDIPVRAIYSSSMSRAVETANIIAEHFYQIEVEPTDTLREVIPSVPARLAAQINEYARNSADFTLADVVFHKLQADDAFAAHFTPVSDASTGDHHDLLVCHGNLIRYLLCRVLDAPLDAWANLFLLHCSVSVVRVDEMGVMTLMGHNLVEHLPPRLRTEV